jgi:hypothetical protein
MARVPPGVCWVAAIAAALGVSKRRDPMTKLLRYCVAIQYIKNTTDVAGGEGQKNEGRGIHNK